MKRVVNIGLGFLLTLVISLTLVRSASAKTTVDVTNLTSHSDYVVEIDPEFNPGVFYRFVIDETFRIVSIDSTNDTVAVRSTTTLQRYNYPSGTFIDSTSSTTNYTTHTFKNSTTGYTYINFTNSVDIDGVPHRFQYLINISNGQTRVESSWEDGVKIS
jgi:hypothetical protein